MTTMVQNLKQTQEYRQILAPKMMRYMKLLSLPIQDLGQYCLNAVTENPLIEIKYPLEDSFDFNGFNEPVSHKYRSSGEKALFVPCIDPNNTSKVSLRLQLFTKKLAPLEEYIGLCIIEWLDRDGYFTGDLAEFANTIMVEEGAVNNVLQIIQTFEPRGVGAKNLADSLSLQYPDDSPYGDLVKKMLFYDAETISLRKWRVLKKKYGLNIKNFKAILSELRRLNPRPALCKENEELQIPYIYPDIIIYSSPERFKIKIAGRGEELLSIDSGYKELLYKTANEEARRYLKSKYSDAKELLSILNMRHKTLYRLTKFICELQKDYLVYGDPYIRPCTVIEASRALDLHPTTILRCLNSKYINTQRGMFPLRHFFSSPVLSDRELYKRGNSVYSVKEMIRSIIASEKSTLLSDQKIADILKESGVFIHRRTVAKYRISLNINSSHKRRGITLYDFPG